MPEAWWDELAAKIKTSENGFVKALNTVADVLEIVSKF
jgi:hypothetical protein